ncbi:MAG: UvrD-helicase domain-containing protein [Spirochaetia bacterium]|nr:UvrD-helicase domain-containing protein [Spirochaetia bacterium]
MSTLESFYFPYGKMISPDDVSNSVFIIPKKYDKAKIRLTVKKLMASHGCTSIMLPEMKTLFEIAMEKTGTAKGSVIMKDDFQYLLDQIPGLPDKFRGENDGYKSAIFSLLNEMAFHDEQLDSYPFYGTVYSAGLDRNMCGRIFSAVRERGFIFRAEIYRLALEEIKKGHDNHRYFLIPGEYYTQLEQSVLESLGVSVLGHDSCDRACHGISPENVRFLRAGSVMEQYSEVRNHILAMMEKDSTLRLDDFCLVTGDSGSLRRCTAYFSSTGMHCISSASVSADTSLTDALNLVFYALNNDTEKLVLYYNRHNADKVLYDSSYEFPVLFRFCGDLAEDKLGNKLLKNNISFRKWITGFSRIENRKGSVEEDLNYLDDTVRRLGFSDVSLYEYRSSFEQIFGENKIELRDMVDYFREILSGRKKNMVSSLNDGVVLVSQGEYIPPCRYIYFADLEENTFLKDKMPNLLLSADEHDEFNHLVYGSTKEEHLIKYFQTGTADSDHIVFVIPDYDEGTVVSEHVENILKLFPSKECQVRVIGSRIPEFRHDFTRTFSDIGWDNVMPDKIRKNRVTGDMNFISRINSDGMDQNAAMDLVLHKLSSVTRIEAFMWCPAKFAYDIQMQDVALQNEKYFDSGKAFHLFCERFFGKKNIRIFDFKKAELEAEVSAYLMGEPCSNALSTYFDCIGVRDIFREVQTRYSGLELKDTDLKKYLMFVCQCMKNKMKDCDSESIRSEVFIGNARMMDSPDIVVAEGYIDLMFRTNTGDIVLLDLKSGNISKYNEDVAAFSNVQLLLYSHIVENAVRTGDYSVFCPADSQQIKEGKCILENDYFRKSRTDAAVDACYVSPKADGMYICRSGIAEGYDDPFESFAEKFRKLLDDAGRNIFTPMCNSGCDYCALRPFCPDSENLQSLDSVYEQLDWHGPFMQDYPELPRHTAESAGTDDMVSIIQFSEKEKVQAISDFDHDIIISAGAGAGKTEVLTTRYLNILLNTDADLSNILCITFTEKAAGEMKKRIFSKIRDTLSLGAFYSLDNGSADPGSYRLTDAQVKKLENVLKNFYRSNRISTFHSFCLNMLTRFEKENKNSVRDISCKVADDYMIRNKKVDILTDLVKKYSERSAIFRYWTEYQTLYTRTVSGETGIIKDLMDFMDSFRLSGLTLDEATGDMLDSHFAGRKDAVVSALRVKYQQLSDKLLEALEAYKETETNEKNLKKLDNVIAEVKNGEIGIGRYPYTKDAELKALAASLQKCPCPDSPECASAEEERELHRLIFSLIIEADRRIEKYKQEKNFIELADYHLNLISLMKNHDILKKIKDELRFIMVDEFQDTNWLQKEILDMIHDDSNRVFFVGDLKQSIYRFLQCDNQIFTYYRDSAKMEYLTFQDNFRSVDQIVDFNNRYFSDNAVDEYNIIPHTSRSVDDIEYGIPKRSDSSYPAVTFVELGYDKDTVEDLKKKDSNSLLREQEATFIARTIASDAGGQYSRWGILVREYTNIKYILEGLRKIGIPYSFVIKRDFFRQPDIQQVMQVIQVIYGYLPADTLMEVPEVAEFASSLTEDDRSRGFCYVVSLLISQPFYASSRPILQEFYCQCCEFASELDDVPEEIIPHMLKLAEANDKEVATSVDNAVKIMTVHSSKGLEFDHLFVSKITAHTGCGENIGGRGSISYVNLVSGENGGRIVDYDVNSIKRLKDDDRHFLYASWMDDVNSHFENIEKANLLYVAFTRAKKRLIVTVQKGEYKDDPGSPDVNWLKNIHGNIFCAGNFAGCCETKTVRIEEIEPLKWTDQQTETIVSDNVELPMPVLQALSVSGYLDQMEPDDENDVADGDDDRKIISGNGNQTGTAVHSYFENNIRILKNNGFDISGECAPERFPVAGSVMDRFCRFVIGGCGNDEFRQLVYEADSLKTETELFFRTSDGQLLNGIVDLILEKGNKVMVLDYKTHTGGSLDEDTMARYREQVRLYIHGLQEIYPDRQFSGALLVMYSNGKTELKRV